MKTSFRRNINGFTLIELLVVVLIIGILSSVALPQYTKAVEKAKLTEPLTLMSSLSKAIDIYLLENGFGEEVNFVGSWYDGPSVELDVDIKNSLDCSSGGDYCYSKNFAYDAHCGTDLCQIRTTRTNHKWQLYLMKRKNNQKWQKECWFYEDEAEHICKSLEGQGWFLSDER